MTSVVNQPNLTEGLSLIGWKLKRNAEIQARKNDANFECEVEPSSTSYAAFEYMSTSDDNYDPYGDINLDLCLEVDAIDINNSSEQTNDDYDPYEVFMRINTRRTVTGRDRVPASLLPSQTSSNSSLVNNYRHYNFADDDTPIKYPLAIGIIDRHLKQQQQQQQNIRGGGYTSRQTNPSTYTGIRRPISSRSYPLNSSLKRVTFCPSDDDLDDENFENDRRRYTKQLKRTTNEISTQRYRLNNNRQSSLIDDDLDNDIAPTVTEMDMLDDDDDNEPITKSMSIPVKLPPSSTIKKSSYIGNILPSFYEQLPQSKKMLLQDATVDSSSNQIDNLTKNSINNHGGEEIIDEENRLQFHHTTTTPTSMQGYKRINNNHHDIKRYYNNNDDDDNNDQHQIRKRYRINDDNYIQQNSQYRYDDYDTNQQTIRIPARRGRPPSQHHHDDPSKISARLISQFEDQYGLKLGDIRVYAPKLRLRISSVNVNWINLPPIPKFPNKVHRSY